MHSTHFQFCQSLAVNLKMQQTTFVNLVIGIAILTILVTVLVIIVCSTNRDIPACHHNGKGHNSKFPCSDFNHSVEPLDVSSLKTGDILGVSYNDMRTTFSSVFYRSVWTHVALIYIEPVSKEPYVLEAAIYRKPYVGGIIRVPLLYWSKINQHARCISLTRINKSADTKMISNAFNDAELHNVGIQGLSIDWLKFYGSRLKKSLPNDNFFAPKSQRTVPPHPIYSGFFPGLFKLTSFFPKFIQDYIENSLGTGFDYVLTCNELLIHVLQESNVYSSRLSPCSFFPSDIIFGRVETKSGFSFEKPIEVSVHHLIQDELPSDSRKCHS